MNPVKPQSQMSEPERDFWCKYAGCLVRRHITGHDAEWHVRRAQAFCYGLNGRRLQSLAAADVHRYLDELDRNNRIVGWQAGQVVSALEILFCELTDCAWAAGFDWAGRRDACRELAPEHATLARTLSAADTVARRTSRQDAALSQNTIRALGRLREVLRVRDRSIRTEQTYSDWSARFAAFCGGEIPEDPKRVVAFLEHLALVDEVAPATQAQALNALVFLYREVLKVELGDLGGYVRPKTRRKLPVVLTHEEVDKLLGAMPGTPGLMARLMYGTGRRWCAESGGSSPGRGVSGVVAKM